MSSGKLTKPKSLVLLAMEKIRDGITSGEYALGAPLYEKVLAEEFGISKTPVREALVQLQHEGLVVVQPHSGTFVFELADGEVTDLCELRLILETNALQLAMRRQRGRLTTELDKICTAMTQAVKSKKTAQYRVFDADFHQAFFKYCGNAYLANSYALIEAKVQTLRVTLNKPQPDLVALSLSEHVRISQALEAGKVDEALDLVTAHIKRSRELMHGLQEATPVNIGKLRDGA